MATTRIPPDFTAFLRLLNANDVQYLVIGGYAVGFHGYVRATADFDIWINPTPENAPQAAEALRSFGFDLEEVTDDLFTAPDRVIRMGIPPFRLEIQTTISGVAFDECWSARIEAELDGVPAFIISLEHLKQNKRAAGRHKDLADLDYLE
jgi:hypothetical protein